MKGRGQPQVAGVGPRRDQATATLSLPISMTTFP